MTEFKADIHELSFHGTNCFLGASEGGKHDTMKYLHSIDENLCKGKDKEGDTALTSAQGRIVVIPMHPMNPKKRLKSLEFLRIFRHLGHFTPREAIFTP